MTDYRISENPPGVLAPPNGLAGCPPPIFPTNGLAVGVDAVPPNGLAA